MDILCPLRAHWEVERLVEAGARTFYAGVDSEVVFGAAASSSPIINCRPWSGYNFSTAEDWTRAIELLKENDGALFATFNWYSYQSWEMEAVVDFLDRSEGLAGVILADVALLTRIRKELPGLRLVLGTVAHTENSSSVAFFGSLGASQIILPRHLRIGEIREIIAGHPDIDYEVFVKNQDCYFSQGLCYYTHQVVDPSMPYECNSIRNFSANREFTAEEMEAWTAHDPTPLNSCGVCAVRDLERAGVTAVKLVGRELPLEKKLLDFEFIRRAIEAASDSPDDFATHVQDLHRQIYGVSCARDCMY